MSFDTNKIFSFYQEAFGNSLKSAPVLAEFMTNKCIANEIFLKSQKYLKPFFELVEGLRPIQVSPYMASMFLPQRFLGVDDPLNLSVNNYTTLDQAVQGCFYLGLFYHFTTMIFPTRKNVDTVNFDKLINEWLPNTLVANLKMREYNSENKGMPETCFCCYYKTNDYDMVFKKDFKVGFFKRPQIKSFLNNIFYSGIMFGMAYDLSTNG